MRNTSDALCEKIKTYLEKAFAERCEKAELTPVQTWLYGYQVLADLPAYPGCCITVDGRTLTDVYTTTFTIHIALGITSDDPSVLEKRGRAWADVLEDTLRADWHLGGAVLDTAQGVVFDQGAVSDLFVIVATLSCTVDVGGYVYDKLL